MDLSEINLCDSANFVAEVPHQWFAALQRAGTGLLARGEGRSRVLGRDEIPRLRGVSTATPSSSRRPRRPRSSGTCPTNR